MSCKGAHGGAACRQARARRRLSNRRKPDVRRRGGRAAGCRQRVLEDAAADAARQGAGPCRALAEQGKPRPLHPTDRCPRRWRRWHRGCSWRCPHGPHGPQVLWNASRSRCKGRGRDPVPAARRRRGRAAAGGKEGRAAAWPPPPPGRWRDGCASIARSSPGASCRLPKPRVFAGRRYQATHQGLHKGHAAGGAALRPSLRGRRCSWPQCAQP